MLAPRQTLLCLCQGTQAASEARHVTTGGLCGHTRVSLRGSVSACQAIAFLCPLHTHRISGSPSRAVSSAHPTPHTTQPPKAKSKQPRTRYLPSKLCCAEKAVSALAIAVSRSGGYLATFAEL
eukprot:3522648-Rhodomonas_salina.3